MPRKHICTEVTVMNTVETFVTASIHQNEKGVKFIRIRFQAGDNVWFTAFNPKGVKDVEWVQRTSRTTGAVRTQTRFPVLVTFERDSVVGSDVVRNCIIKPREFVAKEMEAADAADLAALGKCAAVAPVVPVAAEAADDIG